MCKMTNNKKVLLKRYEESKTAKVGSQILCPSCGTSHTKNSYQTVFCKTKGGTKCKDNYWNNVTPNKRNNRTRISPASRRYLANVILPQKAFERGFPSVEAMINHVDDHDGTWDAHACNVEPCEYCGLRSEYCECDYI